MSDFLSMMKSVPDKDSQEYNDFWKNETKKMEYGLTVDGVYIPGWLYWHTQVWTIYKNVLDPISGRSRRQAGLAEFRDNEWIIADAIDQAEREKKGVMIFGSRRLGKELADYTPIITPTGDVRIVDLKVGDKVLGRDGRVSHVTGVHPQGLKPIYRITLEDGRAIDAGLEHKWVVYKDGKEEVLTTQDMLRLNDVSLPINEPVEKIYYNGTVYSIEDRKRIIKDSGKSPVSSKNSKKLAYLLRSMGYKVVTDENSSVITYTKDKYVKITSIEYIGIFTATCITVDNKDSLYLAKDFIVTHNSEAIASYLSHGATLFQGTENVIMGGNWGDIDIIMQKVVTGLNNIPDYYKFGRLSESLRKEIELGFKEKGGKRNSWSKIIARNHENGVNTEAAAGLTPFRFIMDEIAKALKNDSLLYTPTGTIEIGSAEVGQRIYGWDGKLTTIVGVYPQGVKDLYTVAFDDDREVVCCLDHLWEVFDNKSKKYKVVDTKYLLDNIERDFYVRNNKIVRFNRQSIKEDLFKWGYKVSTADLKTKAFIPSKFLYSSVNQRMELLKGLIKGGGKITNKGSYITCKKGHIASSFEFLVRSLGIKVKPIKDSGRTIKYKIYSDLSDLSNGYKKNKIVSIKYYGKDEATCIKVDNNKSLFLTDNFVVTHNSKFTEVLEAAKPAFTTEYGWMASPILTGCVCADSKVWTNDGRLFNIQNLNPDYGILGFNENVKKVSKEPITWWQPPTDKHCFRIETESGKSLECSDDHPILIKTKSSRKPVFEQTKNLSVSKGHKVAIIDSVPIFGKTPIGKKDIDLTKPLPDKVFSYGKKDVQILLQTIYKELGYIKSKSSGINIRFTSSVQELLEQLQYLLIKFGIHSKTSKDKESIIISDKTSIARFAKYVKVNDKRLVGWEDYLNEESDGIRFERIKKIEYIGIKPVYNLTAGSTNTYIANNIVTHNTSGDIKNVGDAQNYFNNPEANNFIVRFLEEEGGKKTSVFISGLYRMEGKVKSTIGDFVENEKGILLPKDSQLFNIPMQVKDDEKALAVIEQERKNAEKSPDAAALLKQKMYYPLNTQELFLSEEGSSFPVEALTEHLAFLEANIEVQGRPCELYRGEDNQVRIDWNTDKRPILEFPMKKSDFNAYKKDAPVVIYEEPKDTDIYFLHIAGLDSYNMSSSKWSTSLGSLYIFKRAYDPIGGTFQRRIVAEYTARPADIKDFHDNCIMLLELYKATCMIENEAQTTISVFDLMGKSNLLADGYSLLKEISPKTSITGRNKGLPGTPAVQKHYKELVYRYLTEEIVLGQDADGKPIKKLGLVRIPSIGLVKELIHHRDDEGNFDRYVAFGHALAYEVWAEKMYPLDYTSEPPKESFSKPTISSPFITGGPPFLGKFKKGFF